MENKIIYIDVSPETDEEITENAGVMWEHNATSIVFNIDPAYAGDYRYYLEYRSIIGTKVRTEYLDLDTETNTVTYNIPVTMTSLRGVECYFNIVEIDGDGQTVKVIKSRKFCLQFDYSPDTDNSLAKVNDFSINALLEAIRLGIFKGEKGDSGEIANVDSEMSDTSENAVQNKVIKAYVDTIIKNAQKLIDSKDNALRTDLSNVINESCVLKEEGKGLSSNDFTDEYVEKLNNLANENGEIPDYWQAALDEGVNAMRQAMETAGRNKSSFLFYSDAHWDYGSQMSPKLLKYLYNNTAITKTFFGGDIVNSESSDRDSMEYLYEWREMLKGLPNHHSVVGNHDDGNSTNNLFSENYIYAYLLASEETPDMVLGDGMYYYIDEPCEKTRYLFLDTAYKGVDTAQMEFITQALKSTQSGWHIAVVAHTWYQPDYDQYDVRPIPIAGLDTNASKVITLLDNYNSRIGDFAECEGWVEFCIGGHTHIDYDNVTSTGIPIILVETDSQHIRSDLSFTAGTTTESSVNGIIADYENHKIYVVRIGRGESREIEVTNYVINYTNVLPLAVDADGTTVYNTIGYKADTRWSTSSSVDVEASGIYVSGYIPCSKGDVIRLKNITMPNENSNNCMVHFFTAIGTNQDNSNNENLTSYSNAVWENDKLVQFTITVECGYFRIQGTYMGEDSIVTINENIQ